MKITKNYLLLAIIFTSVLIVSNITGMKISQFGEFHLSAAVLLFPVTYIISDILTEVYGFAASRTVIWLAIIANMIVVVAAYLLCFVPSSAEWHHQEAFNLIFKFSPIIFIASIISYLFGEFINSFILAKLKIATQGKYFFMRAIVSTIISAAVDTTLFNSIAFLNILPTTILLNVMLSEFCFKLLIEILVFPITKLAVTYLKKTDKIDHYDNKTIFNPFTM